MMGGLALLEGSDVGVYRPARAPPTSVPTYLLSLGQHTTVWPTGGGGAVWTAVAVVGRAAVVFPLVFYGCPGFCLFSAAAAAAAAAAANGGGSGCGGRVGGAITASDDPVTTAASATTTATATACTCGAGAKESILN